MPIIGYRFRCKNCPNHDICEACHERWDNGKGSMANGLAKQQISLDPKDHDFFIHKERGFKPLVKTAGPTQKSEKKLKVSTRTLRGCSHSRDSRARTNRHQFLYRRPSRRLAQPSCNPGDDWSQLRPRSIVSQPNDPCSCGSGKKAKKCGCGAFS